MNQETNNPILQKHQAISESVLNNITYDVQLEEEIFRMLTFLKQIGRK